jgi:hypothetical protein
MDPVTMAALYAGGALLSGGGGYLGAQKTAAASQQAGGTSALMQALAMQQAQQRFNEAKGLLSPYATAGSGSIEMLTKYMKGDAAKADRVGGGGANLLSTFEPTMAQLEATPGYQFARSQGLGAMTNAAAAKGLGTSGNLLRGLGEYGTGFASQTFNDQLKNYLIQNQQAFNMLMGPAQIGMQAGQSIMQGTSQFNPQMMAGSQGVGTAYGQGLLGQANAEAQGYNVLAGNIGSAMQMPAFASMYGRGPTGTTSYSGVPSWLGSVLGGMGYSNMGYGPQQR